MNPAGSNQKKPDGKNHRKMLGPAGIVRLSPDESVTIGLVIGEGIETVLAAMFIVHHGTLLRPAWALLTAPVITSFPVLSGIEHLTILVDNDASGSGERNALACAQRWTQAGPTVELFTTAP